MLPGSSWVKALTCAAGAVVVLTAVTQTALASRAPGSAERRNIVSAIADTMPLTPASQRPAVRGIRISTVRTPSVRWGRAVLVPKPGGPGDGALVIVGRFGRAWMVIDVGTSGAGCWLERRVRRDLRITDCPRATTGPSRRSRRPVARRATRLRGR